MIYAGFPFFFGFGLEEVKVSIFWLLLYSEAGGNLVSMGINQDVWD